MTEELFQALAKSEDVFERVKARKYTPSPGLAALQNMLAAIREHRPNYRTNLGCSSCVRTLIMEAAGLYLTAARAQKNALCICTISDQLLTDEHLTSEERQTSFREMMQVALETAVKLEK